MPISFCLNYHGQREWPSIPQSVAMHKCHFNVVTTRVVYRHVHALGRHVCIRDSTAASAATLLQIAHGILMTTGPASTTIFACEDIDSTTRTWELNILHGRKGEYGGKTIKYHHDYSSSIPPPISWARPPQPYASTSAAYVYLHPSLTRFLHATEH